MAHEFTTRHRIEFADTDAAGVAHFTTYFRLMEETEHAFYRSLGGSGFERYDTGDLRGMPRASASCDYVAPLRYADEVDVSLRVQRMGRSSIGYAFVFRRWPDGLLAATGRMAVVHATGGSENGFRAAPLPDFLREGAEVATGR